MEYTKSLVGAFTKNYYRTDEYEHVWFYPEPDDDDLENYLDETEQEFIDFLLEKAQVLESYNQKSIAYICCDKTDENEFYVRLIFQSESGRFKHDVFGFNVTNENNGKYMVEQSCVKYNEIDDFFDDF